MWIRQIQGRTSTSTSRDAKIFTGVSPLTSCFSTSSIEVIGVAWEYLDPILGNRLAMLLMDCVIPYLVDLGWIAISRSGSEHLIFSSLCNFSRYSLLVLPKRGIDLATHCYSLHPFNSWGSDLRGGVGSEIILLAGSWSSYSLLHELSTVSFLSRV